MIHVLVFVIEWSLMDTQLHDVSQQISEVAVVIRVRMFLADVGGKSFVATGHGWRRWHWRHWSWPRLGATAVGVPVQSFACIV